MKTDANLSRSLKILLNGVEYDRYTIESIEWKLSSNILNVKVAYANLTESKYTGRTWPVEGSAEVNVNVIIETIHQLHEKLKA